MAAYARSRCVRLPQARAGSARGSVETAYAHDGFTYQLANRTAARATVVPLLQDTLSQVAAARPEALKWTVLLEFPLYRLRRRIDVVLLTQSQVIVIETKVGATAFSSLAVRQVEEYALDLRDFHAGSLGRCIVPILVH